jgi:3-oxoacyl-[acyl-carrier protein] reductase
MRVDLDGKAAIVTGGSKGIGYAIAEALAESGADVVICARNEEEVHRAASELEGRWNARVTGVACDMRRYDDVRALVQTAIDRFGRLDILVNNAGVGSFAPVDEITPDDWHRVVETNLNGAYYASHEAIPHMKRAGGGWIINIGSLAGKNALPGGAAYNASKFGLLGFSEAMMLDVRQHDIRVSCIMPGSVETEFSGPGSHGSGGGEWKLQPGDLAEMVVDLLAFHPRALPSRVEMRPSRPPKK